MSRTRKDAARGGHRERKLSVRSVRLMPPDVHKMSRAVLKIALEQAAAEKAAQAAVEAPRTERSDD